MKLLPKASYSVEEHLEAVLAAYSPEGGCEMMREELAEPSLLKGPCQGDAVCWAVCNSTWVLGHGSGRLDHVRGLF